MTANEGYHEEHYQTAEGIAVTICRPLLTETERERRIEQTRTAMQQLYEAWCRQDVPWHEEPK